MRRMTILVAAIVALALLAWSVRDLHRDSQPAPRLQYALEPGQRFTYELEFEAEHSVALPGSEAPSVDTGLATTTKLEGEVEVEVLAQKRDHWVLSWRVTKVDAAALRLGGVAAVDEAEARAMLSGRSVLVEMNFDGTIGDIMVDEHDPEPFHNVMKLVVAHTQFVVPRRARGAWSTREHTLLGSTEATYRLGERAGESAEIEKSVRRYHSFLSLPWIEDADALEQDVDDEHTIRFAGVVEALGGSRSVEVRKEDRVVLRSASEIRWTLTARHHVPPTRSVDQRLAELRHDRLEAVADSPLAERNALRQQAGDATLASVQRYIRGVTAEQIRAESHGQFMWNATGLLLLDPSLCAELVDLFEDEGASQQSRYLAADLLAAVGHSAAQASLREILQTDAARADDAQYASLVQRLGQLTAPDSATANLALASYRRADRPHETTATALTVGAVVSNLPAGSPERETLYATLLEGLEEASSYRDQRELLRALANAGQVGNVDVAAHYATSASSGVRAASALAVMKVQGPEADALLGRLAGDDSPSVQLTAFQVLGERRVDPDVQAQISEQIQSGVVVPGNYRAAVEAIRRFPPSNARSDLLRTMAARTLGDPKLRSRLNALAADGAA